MRLNSVIGLAVLLLLCTNAPAQDSISVAPGTTFVVQTSKDMGSGTAKTGDEFVLYVVHPVAVKGGKVPRGAKVTARVIEVVHSTKEQRKGRLVMIAEKAEWDGGSVALQALPISAAKRPKPGAKGLVDHTVSTGIGKSFTAGMEEGRDDEPSPVDDPKPLDVNPGLAFENPNGDTEILAGSTFIIRQLKPQVP